ncbi:MAG: GDP-L-fucose synthase [Candidatus Sedimenticola sp. 20ELBAFRAG]
MDLDAKIYVAGHRGLVGLALIKNLSSKGFSNFVTRTHSELDLTDQAAVESFFADEKPQYVFLAAAKVGGIHANNEYPAEFIYDNIMIQANVIHSSYNNNVSRLLFLGSSCIYPKMAPQPMKEEYLLTGPLEPTNRPYALAKIAGIEMCWSYNRQYGTRYLAVMPTNLYGPGDNYHPVNSHVIPGLIHRFHGAKESGSPAVTVWGTGLAKREFLYSDDMADACVYLMGLSDTKASSVFGVNADKGADCGPPVVNIGVGVDISIRELANMIKEVVGFKGQIIFDESKPDGAPRKCLAVNRLDNLGWKPAINLEQGLKKAYQDYMMRST